MEKVSKRFPGTLAVDNVDFAARAGEVHALIGENGAGKSTLMRMIAGTFDDYAGRILIGGKPVRLHSPALARANGIQMIHQELSLAPPLSVAENVLAGRLPSRWGLLGRKAMAEETRRCLGRVGLDLDPWTPVEELSQHEAQLVEIARAVGNNPCILVMDEPTSALSREEVNRLFAIIRKLREERLAIIYISHHMPEVLEIADRVTVLRDGRNVATRAISEVSAAQMIELMVGRSLSELYAQRRNPRGAEKLRVEHFSRYGFFHDVSFSVSAGEILGLCGLAGAGRSELARSLCGIDPADDGGIYLDGALVEPANFLAAIRLGFAYLTEDRKAQGLALRMTVAENALAAVLPRFCRAGFYSQAGAAGLLSRLIEALRIQPPEPARPAGSLSGGNQQKLLMAKWLASDPQVLILDEPTRGVDVGAKVLIHKAIAEVADRGKSVILISSDLPELVGLSDRILIMRKGHILGQMDKARATEAAVLLAASGFGELLPV